MKVQTVTGPIRLSEIGRTLMHEHILIAWHGIEFDPEARINRPEIIAEAVKRLTRIRQEFGVQTFVDPCPIELGRDVNLLAEISEKSEVQIVCATGFYYEDMGLPPYWKQASIEEIAELYISELINGVGKTSIKPGIIKVATGAPEITATEARFIAAASIASKEAGVPIITHTQDGKCGPEQQALFSHNGVALNRCLIGHCCGNPDPNYHRKVVDAGSYIGFDRIGLERYQSDEVRADNLATLVGDRFLKQIVMSQDRFCHLAGKLPPAIRAERQKLTKLQKDAWPPDYTHLFTDFIPKLRNRGIIESDIFSIIDDNPRRFFGAVEL